jgi:dienelactone hydrolase
MTSNYFIPAWRSAAVLVLVLLLSACTTTQLAERQAASALIASEAGWQPLKLDTGTFVLTAFVPPGLQQTKTLTIYIEGDGLAWINASTPSRDPTPLNPLGLQLALRDPSGTAVYLARPCQFVAEHDKRNCQRKHWTNQRFSPEVIAASLNAIQQLKQRFAAQRLVLIGYSGGAAVASLVAAQRQDVDQLITVAGNLDQRTWTQTHHLSPLDGSLNPADAWMQLQTLRQTHFVGGQDNNIGPTITHAYAARFPPSTPLTIKTIEAFDHHCCWVEQWPELLKELGHE